MELLFRPRRLRRRQALRRMVRETHLRPEDFIYPMFAAPGSRVRQEVTSMPGVFRLSVDLLVDEAKAAHGAGVPAVLLFGLPRQGRQWLRGRLRQGCGAASSPAPQEQGARTDGGHRRLPLRVHRSRPLRLPDRTTRWTTTPPWSCWPRRRCPMPRPAPTWSRPPT